MIIKPLISEDEAKETSQLFQKCWQDTYKNILPDVFLDNIPEKAWVKRLNESGRHNLIFVDDDNQIRAAVSYGRQEENIAAVSEEPVKMTRSTCSWLINARPASRLAG